MVATWLGPQISGRENIYPSFFWARCLLIIFFSSFEFSLSSWQSDRAMLAYLLETFTENKADHFIGNKKKIELLEGFLKQILLLWIRKHIYEFVMKPETWGSFSLRLQIPCNSVYFRDNTLKFSPRKKETEGKKIKKKSKREKRKQEEE